MALIDLHTLLEPVPGAQPTGTNLEYDPAFAELERSVQGKPDQQIGQSIVPGEPPDWKAVEDKAIALSSRTKDLRVASHLLRALLNRGGYEGLSEGLAAVRGLLEQHWALLHPQLDPDDNNDPTIRVNALAVLSDGATLTALRSAPLLRSRSFGKVGLRELAFASGELAPPADAPKWETAAIEAAFQDCPLPELDATSQALRACSEHVKAIEQVFADQTSSVGPDLSGMVRLLRQAEQFLLPRLESRRAAEGGTNGVDGPVSIAAATSSGGASLSGEIRSREDVVRALDKICAYYSRHEPSSPLPLLLQRCKRLATMSFMEIVREMMPDGLSQVEAIAGKGPES
jgi:type VI secretion system protein ImpA